MPTEDNRPMNWGHGKALQENIKSLMGGGFVRDLIISAKSDNPSNRLGISAWFDAAEYSSYEVIATVYTSKVDVFNDIRFSLTPSQLDQNGYKASQAGYTLNVTRQLVTTANFPYPARSVNIIGFNESGGTLHGVLAIRMYGIR